MARKVQEESSSSQNVKRFIQKISERGSGVEIFISDSSPFFIMSDDYSGLDITSGEEISSEMYEKLKTLDEKTSAVKKSIDLLSISPQTEYLIKIKLMKRGFSAPAVSGALEYLSNKKLVNDREYAEQWISSRLKKNPSGPFVLKGMLSAKGVDRETADSVVNSFFTEETMHDLIIKQAEKLKRKKDITEDKLIKKLLSKGFPMKEIRKYFSNNLFILN